MSDDILFTAEELNARVGSGEIKPNLPPPGHKREEVLAQRKDELAQKAEELSQNVGAIDPSVFEEDHDIQRDIRKGFLDVDVGPQFMIKWVNFVNQHSSAVWKAKAEGWKVVTADMVKDADSDLIREDNTLRVGDVICMYIRKDKHLLLQRKAETRALKRQFGLEAELNDIARKHPKALKVHNATEGKYSDTIEKRAARRTAMQHLGNQMKKGTIPGVPIR
jgi:hypothetical protein